MPSKYPIIKPETMIAFLQNKGFYYVKQKGSHRKYSDGKRTVIIPMHDELAKGTLKSILEQADISLEELLKYIS